LPLPGFDFLVSRHFNIRLLECCPNLGLISNDLGYLKVEPRTSTAVAKLPGLVLERTRLESVKKDFQSEICEDKRLKSGKHTFAIGHRRPCRKAGGWDPNADFFYHGLGNE
jgi:hypothetical protein